MIKGRRERKGERACCYCYTATGHNSYMCRLLHVHASAVLLTLWRGLLHPPHWCRQCREHVCEPAWGDPSLWLNQYLWIVVIVCPLFVTLSLSLSPPPLSLFPSFLFPLLSLNNVNILATLTHLHIFQQSQIQWWTKMAPLPQQLWLWPVVSSLCLVDHEEGHHVCVYIFLLLS